MCARLRVYEAYRYYKTTSFGLKFCELKSGGQSLCGDYVLRCVVKVCEE